MIYEIFKTIIGTDWNWSGFAIATLVSAYAVYIGAWIVGHLITKGYEFVQDGEAKIRNFMDKFTVKLTHNGDPNSLKNGWYNTREAGLDTYWNYLEFRDGIEISHQDRRPDGVVDIQKGHYRHTWFNELTLPLTFVLLILVIDVAPLFALMCVVCWGILLTARSCVRVSKKLTKHMNDSEAHSKPSE